MLAAAASCAVVAWVAVLWFTLPDVSGLAKKNPKTTALIEQRRAEAAADGRRFAPRQRWTTLDRVSPRLVHAVIVSEDAKFFGHEGFDWEAIRDAAERGVEQGHFSRGGSTITQQLAKNLYLGTERTLSRKVKEALLAVKLEQSLSKRRILALYLNVAEWAPGTFGVEAASRRWFGCSASELSTAQAAILASMLPAPRKAALGPAPRWLARRARRCVGRLRSAGRIDASDQAWARVEVDRLLAGESGLDEEPPKDDDSPRRGDPPSSSDAVANGREPPTTDADLVPVSDAAASQPAQDR
ncbi:MAG TPA: monofunctional biosynthetic peptidoglycan transglycosylase [Anaeromyxobacteraceae bacterium]|nr:monofunctional biosynthetic peptidoglycan transglycosylase [Anaeromyxobacteraceae bacterium]